MSPVSPVFHTIETVSTVFFCWLPAWRWPYRGSPWRLNLFVFLALYQHSSFGCTCVFQDIFNDLKNNSGCNGLQHNHSRLVGFNIACFEHIIGFVWAICVSFQCRKVREWTNKDILISNWRVRQFPGSKYATSYINKSCLLFFFMVWSVYVF